MKILHEQEPWPSKVNFVDENEVHLGFDTQDDCCANGGWFLSDKKDEWLEETFKEESMDLPGWTFDPSYFANPEFKREYDDGGTAQFRIVKGAEEKFITLYNHHNGYYSKGFEFKVPSDASRNKEDSI